VKDRSPVTIIYDLIGKDEVNDRPRPHLKIRSHPKKF
jgi:hypothetical protein